jgi:hypothetical protein
VHSRRFCTSQRVHLARMVNARFPQSMIYGFEMVDKPALAAARQHQSKIYTESRGSLISSRIFREFSTI